MVVKFVYYFLAVFLLIIPVFIAIGIFIIIKQRLIALNKKNAKTTFITMCIVIAIGLLFLTWSFYDGYNLIFTANEIKLDENNKFSISNINNINIQQPEIDLTQNEINNNEAIEKKEDNNILKLRYSDDFVASVMELYENIEDKYSYDLSNFKEEKIAYDIADGKEYTISQLFDQKILIPYKENSKEILFYGQCNENSHWDGTCIFNIYGYSEEIDDNVLETILEAEYDDGKLISYRKVIKTRTTQNINIWSIFYGEIIYKDDKVDHAEGETWNYYRVNDYLQEFVFNNANVKDVIHIEEFENTLKNFSFIEGYYCGNISNGYYNDDTGNAYIVKYTEGGFIRTIYVGRFKNGLPDDQSGNAWQIVFDNYADVNRYFYYKGKFSNNKRQGKVTPDAYVTQEEINEIINGIQFNCELNWYDERNNQDNNAV